MAVVTEDKGRQARTQYHVINYVGNYSLLEIRTQTGRTHQIRVHLAAIGYPVMGDKVYGIQFKLGFSHYSGLRYQQIGYLISYNRRSS